MRANRPADIWARALRQGECLIWKGTVLPSGYGHVSYQGTQWRVHRLAFRLAVGSIPDGLRVLHRPGCTSRACIEPTHLYAGSDLDNARDRDITGTTFHGPRRADGPAGDRNASRLYPEKYRGVRKANAKLDEMDVRAIRSARSAGLTLAAIAAAFDVTDVLVSRIARRLAWSHV